MENKLEEMFENYLKEDCMCMGSYSSCDSLLYDLYLHFGISKQMISERFCSIYSKDGKFYIPKDDFRRVIDFVGV